MSNKLKVMVTWDQLSQIPVPTDHEIDTLVVLYSDELITYIADDASLPRWNTTHRIESEPSETSLGLIYE